MLRKNKNVDWKNSLCEHKPEDNVWLKIEAQLNFDAYLTQQIENLPSHTPNVSSWEKIEANLPRKKSIRFQIIITSVAASIAAIVMLTTFFMLTKNDNQLNVVEANNALIDSNMEQMAIAEIKNFCKQDMPTCKQNNFKELMQLFDELKSEETELKHAIEQLGDSPEMIQALIKNENMKSETIQNMIILIQS